MLLHHNLPPWHHSRKKRQCILYIPSMTIHLCLYTPVRQFLLALIIYSGWRALWKVTATLDIWNNVLSRPYAKPRPPHITIVGLHKAADIIENTAHVNSSWARVCRRMIFRPRVDIDLVNQLRYVGIAPHGISELKTN